MCFQFTSVALSKLYFSVLSNDCSDIISCLKCLSLPRLLPRLFLLFLFGFNAKEKNKIIEFFAFFFTFVFLLSHKTHICYFLFCFCFCCLLLNVSLLLNYLFPFWSLKWFLIFFSFASYFSFCLPKIFWNRQGKKCAITSYFKENLIKLKLQKDWNWKYFFFFSE